MLKHALYSLTVVALALSVTSQTASGALVGVLDSNNNMSVVGPGIGTFAAGQCNNPANIVLNGCDAMTGQLQANFLDGAIATFKVGISIRDNGVNTTSALIRITDLLIVNPTLNVVTDTFFVVSDIFAPSVAGPVGVGIFGAFGQVGGGIINGATAQGQMNFLTNNPIGGGGGAPPGGFTLTTIQVNGTGVLAPVGFWAMNVQNDPLGGVIQLVGALQFSLAPGSFASMPGSMIITDNATEALEAELPEPGTMALTASTLIGALALIRRRQRQS